MKRLLLIIITVIVLTGCSLSADSTDSEQFAHEMNLIIIDWYNNHEKLYQIENLYYKLDEFEKSAQMEEKQVENEVTKKLIELKILNLEYKKEVEDLKNKISDYQEKAAKLEDPELKKTAETLLIDFHSILNEEMEYTNIVGKQLDMSEVIDKSEEKGDKTQLAKLYMEYDKLDKDMMKVKDDLFQKSGKLNESWNHYSVKTNVAGISFFREYYDSEELANEINSVLITLNKYNKLDSRIINLTAEVEDLNSHGKPGDSQAIQEFMTKIVELKKITADYKKEVEQHKRKIAGFQAIAVKSENAEQKKLADKFLADLQSAIDAQLKYIEINMKLISLHEVYFHPGLNDQSVKGKFGDIENEYFKIYNILPKTRYDLTYQLFTLNKFWNELSELTK